MATVTSRRFVQFAWVALGVTVLVILWGAVVRATGSGAGCGSHWPLCNGVAVPLAPATSTVIEYVHRLTSGMAMLLSLGLVFGSRRVFPRGHQARRWAVITFVFMMIEAAVGAGLVLLGLVEDNASAMRAGYIAVHLFNTMLLMGAMTSVVWWARLADDDGMARRSAEHIRPLTAILAGLVVVAASGAVVALGDTLFPSGTLAEGVRADFDATAHFLIRLRIWHPALAAVVGSGLFVIALKHPMFAGPSRAFSRRLVLSLVVAQVGLGVITMVALAPLPLQIAHLLLSTLLWISVVWSWWNATDEFRTPRRLTP
jgi:heme A synthase